jgi:hypothetical protein
VCYITAAFELIRKEQELGRQCQMKTERERKLTQLFLNAITVSSDYNNEMECV